MKPPRLWLLVGVVSVLALAYTPTFLALTRYAASSELYSHILLIPAVSLYSAWGKRKELGIFLPSPAAATLPAALGFATLALYWGGWFMEPGASPENEFSLRILSFLCFLYAVLILFMGWSNFRHLIFPALFLLFTVPLPSAMLLAVQGFLQHGSAVAADLLFKISGTPALRQGTFFELPGMSLQVAPQCSGIHSTLVLFITSLVAANFLLSTSWRRAVLVLAIVPLALLRNGFRIFVIGQLCVHYGPEMIHSYIHRKGGPIFFALSMIPLGALLIFLVKSEQKKKKGVKGLVHEDNAN